MSIINNKITKTISFTSGKGGVGKTSLVCNVASFLSRMGNKVLILDGDLGMANVDVMFRAKPQSFIEEVLNAEKMLEEVIVAVDENIDLIPGGSGIYELQNINIFQKRLLLDQVNQLEGKYDFMLIDTSPGIADNVLYLNSAAQEIFVVVTPDPSSLTDAYALIKVLNQRHKEKEFSILCNMVRDEHEAMKIYKKLSDVCNKFLHVGLDYKGYVPLDQKFRGATRNQQLVLDACPRCPSSFALNSVAQKLSHIGYVEEPKGGMQFFWEQLVGVA